MDKLELAMTCDRIIRQSAGSLEKSTLRIGWYRLLLQENSLFRDLGFDDEEDYRQSVQIEKTAWHRGYALAKAFKAVGMDRDTFMSMKLESAEVLSRQSEDVRRDPKLIEQAAKLTCRDFTALFHASGIRVAGSRREQPRRGLPFVLEMSAKDRKEVHSVIEGWMRSEGFETRAEALLDIVRFAQKSISKARSAA